MSFIGTNIINEEPLSAAVRPRGCRAGRREQQRRRSHSAVALETPNEPQQRYPQPTAARDAPIRKKARTKEPQPAVAAVSGGGDNLASISITLSDGGRDVAAVGTQRALPACESAYTPQSHVRRSLLFCDVMELVGAVYDAARTRIIGEITLFGQPATGRMSMGTRFQQAPPTNATFLATVDPFDCIPDDTMQTAHAFAAMIDVHRRIPRGMLWFDRGDATWQHEMEMSRQPGAAVHHGNRRIRVVFVRPMS